MSSKNIFEVLQNIAENTESNEKFLNILKENGFTGTLEEAENQINQQTQVVLNNLTTEDLQNIAGGKSLMNDKLKKAIAVGGASLMAAGTVTPGSLAANKNDAKKFADSALNYVKKNPVHTGVTTALGLATTALLVKSIFGGKTIPGLSFTNESGAFLWDKDLSKDRAVVTFIEQLSDATCTFVVEDGKDNTRTIKFTATKNSVLKGILENSDNPILFTTEVLLKTLLKAMDAKNEYVDANGNLTANGASVLNNLTEYIVTQINNEIDAREEQKVKKGELGTAVTNAKQEVDKAQTDATQKAAAAKAAKDDSSLNSEDEQTKADAEAKVKSTATESEDATRVLNEKKNNYTEAEEKLKKGIQDAKKEAKKLAMPTKKFQAGDAVTAPEQGPENNADAAGSKTN